MKQLEGDFDYIVVGAGTAGCIVANRLSGSILMDRVHDVDSSVF